jgi:predicted nucleotidyltransferase component of viral defense system
MDWINQKISVASKNKIAVSEQSKLQKIRRLVITAMFSDDVLMDRLVLKGGNALDIVHKLGTRTSLDIDLSMREDFDPEDLQRRIVQSLKDRFDSAGFVVFDDRFSKRPEVERAEQPPHWGGYCVEFKLIEKAKFNEHGGNLEVIRRNAEIVGSEQKRTFAIDISKYEFCEGKESAELDHYTVYVYPLPMIALEKLRAICQQMPEYTLRRHPTARARDFYDVHTIVTQGKVKLATPENAELLRQIFAAKDVPVALLNKIVKQREFHRPDWAAVVNSVSGKLKDFDFYFDFVLDLVRALQACGV